MTQKLDNIIEKILKHIDKNTNNSDGILKIRSSRDEIEKHHSVKLQDNYTIPDVPQKYIVMLIDAGYIIGNISKLGKPEVICLSLKGQIWLDQVHNTPVAKQPRKRRATS